ncbi:MAG: restriction endonuclease [Anaerolineae bacterium]|nr:restriction endonuclease [Anaerolineae bacterium]
MTLTSLTLTEHTPHYFENAAISQAVGHYLWHHHRNQVAVEFPSPKTGQQWQLTNQGWVGFIPVGPDVRLNLQPKVGLANLFAMMAYAYDLNSFRLLDGLIDCRSMAEFYERLAIILAERVLDRVRQGLYQAYRLREAELPYVRGQLQLPQALQPSGRVSLPCRYETQTVDNADNQILAWTLFRLARSGVSTTRSRPLIQRAYRALQQRVTISPYPAQACVGRVYNRLNDDYRQLHALCHFFLAQSGPSHHFGDRAMIPFLVNMAHLFEKFVASWLTAHLSDSWRVVIQERVPLGTSSPLTFQVDLAIYDAETQQIRWVLDTKYKSDPTPATEDIQQVLSYAHTKGCREAVLVYPAPLPQPFDEEINGIRIRSVAFSLTDDLAVAGQNFIDFLLREAH